GRWKHSMTWIPSVLFTNATSPVYAASLVERLYEAVVILENHPRFGRKVPEIDHDLVRELVVEHYRVVYQLMRDRIEIVAVLAMLTGHSSTASFCIFDRRIG